MKEKKGEHPFGDAGQLVLLGLFLIVWILDSFILQWSTFLAEHIPLVYRLVFLGITLIIAAYLFKSGHVVISNEQRPAGLISTGVFRYVRHPLYLGTILTYLGLTVSSASLFSLALLVVIVLFYDYIAGYEEKLLEAKLGQAYTRYKKKTGRWFPRIGQKASAE